MTDSRTGDPLRQVDRDLFVCEQPLRVGGLALGLRATLVRLPSGGLFVHSPPRPDPALCAAVQKLGPVEAIAAPNRLHHLFLAPFARAFPEARVYVSPGLAAKRADLPPHEALSDVPVPAWADVLDQHLFGGQPRVDEVVFFHRPTRTLIVSDLAFNVQSSSSFFTRLFMRANDGYGRFGPTRLVRRSVTDRAAARASIDRILEWDFERVIVAHGDVLEAGGREALRRGFAWLRAV